MINPVRARARLLVVLTLLASATAAGGCVYRMQIQQGNFLDPKTVEQLQVGMTRSQVRFLLGTPMVPDAFDRDRWDYLYYLDASRIGEPERRLLTVYFESDKVARIERDGIPASEQGPGERSAQQQQQQPASGQPSADPPQTAESPQTAETIPPGG